ncbi:MAG: DUF58 domain-containing protein [Candidatus Latescibacterota bacterium]|nr:DUF58 domain-containing protein [Candidatus Latescibacterota bacterium]MEE2628184.1 DUF58 domain-containing protein [Candidatus Latescibacterota bacterium]MEE2726368.1 DUF58 domain-containing protein [Candidatus Latescibacterota bacterium]
MIPKEILEKVRLIEIRSRNVVNDLFAGEYHSAFKGRGMEFAEVREYLRGDDVRTIDWNVTARTGSPYVKVFDEEREQTVMLLVDASASGAFGSARQMKGEVGVEISALLAFAAIKNNDRVGLLIFTDVVEVFVPPKKGRKHVLRVIRELLYFQPQGKRTSITSALDYLEKVLHRRSVVFLISDFIDEHYERSLQLMKRRHDLVAVSLFDPRERALPDVGFINLQDAETGEQFLVDSGRQEVRAYFARQQEQEDERRRALFLRNGVDEVSIDITKSYVDPLVRLFHARVRKRG